MADIDQVMVSIRFSGFGLDPKNLGRTLCFKKGENTDTRIIKRKSGKVIWSIAVNKNTFTIEHNIRKLLLQFTQDIDVWKSGTSDTKANIFCGLFLDGWNRGFSLSPTLLKDLADRNLEIGFDIYAPVETWE